MRPWQPVQPASVLHGGRARHQPFARLAPAAPASGGRSTRRQQPAYAQHFLRLLENQGSWEAAGGHTTAGGAAPCMPPPAEAWEGLGQHAPELAELACTAADVASSLQYFEVRPRRLCSQTLPLAARH